MTPRTLNVALRKEEESWASFARRIKGLEGEIVVVLSERDAELLRASDERDEFFTACSKVRYRLSLAVRDSKLVAQATARGIKVNKSPAKLKRMLAHHPMSEEVLRHVSPQLWRQQWRSRLQSMGLLSLPKLRVMLLIGLSCGLFFFVIFRLLPSADLLLWPRQETVSQTMNVVLVLSGATAIESPGVPRLPLLRYPVTVQKSLVYDQISREFTGTNAELPMRIANTSSEVYSLRKGTRFVNQAGMIFKILSSVEIPAGSSVTVRARAESRDLYQEVIGERGNVPVGIRFDIPGLTEEEQKLVYGVNTAAGRGGKTSSRMVFRKTDLENAQEVLRKTLLAEAKKRVDEMRELQTLRDPNRSIELFTKADVTRLTYSGFVLPLTFVDRPVSSVPISGNLTYEVFGYDSMQILELLRKQNERQVTEGKRTVPESMSPDRLRVYIISYADDLSWIKVTADLAAVDEFIFDPLTPSGARFGRRVREQVRGLPVKDALRILRNLPEVQKVSISVWPPWSGSLPTLPSHIRIVPQ